jgi:hypothetical protein
LGSLLKISASLILISLNLAAYGNDPFRMTMSAKDAGMGFVSLTRNGFWSSFRNQALLSENKSLSAAINYENRFALKELGTRTIGIKIPSGKTSLGLIWSDFGYSGFRREFTGVSCGMKLSDLISAGIQIDYIMERGSADYSAYHAVTYEAGMLLKTSESSGFGIHIINGVPGSLRKRFLPSVLSIGAGTSLSEVLYAGAEAELSSGSGLTFRTGFEYETARNFWLRGGWSSNNNSFCFGLGYLAKIVQIDLAFVTHEKLGVTSSVSMVFKIK